MDQQKSGAQISRKAFFQSLIILLVLMILAGILTLVIPAGSYSRSQTDGLEFIDPDSFQYIDRPVYPVWRWLTAPVEVLWKSENSLTIIVIIIFLLLVGAAFAVLDKSGIIMSVIARIVKLFGDRKYLLLMVISFFFMAIGAFFGIFEEVIPLIPIMLALSYYLGWDSLVGLGMSILATNMGFSAAITNPFTIGISQQIAGLPTFSGTWLRIIIFICMYSVFSIFLVTYAKKIEKKPESSSVYKEDQEQRLKYNKLDLSTLNTGKDLKKAMLFFLVFLLLIFATLFGSPFIPAISGLALPLVGILFFIGGIGAGLLSKTPAKEIWQAAREGLVGISPGIPLILMAASIKFIADSGGIMDTILHSASQVFSNVSPFLGAVLIYMLALIIEFFIGSATAKAFLLMPILLPLGDLVGVTRQVSVTAYCFGDGFSNLAYPTNPVLLIALGLTVVSYPKWMKWSLKLWGWVLLVTLFFLWIGVRIGYGPF
ncbi:MAG: YfcC family protein [Anaerolineaceae bacterium]|nr:YfcC family protein [Anaerolineaceae bacterium]